MIVYTDADGQVVAVYSHDTASKAWESFTRIEVTDPVQVNAISRFGRDCKVTDKGVQASVNPVQPQPTPDTPSQARFKELKGKLLADQISDAEVRELLKLQFTPGAAAMPATRGVR